MKEGLGKGNGSLLEIPLKDRFLAFLFKIYQDFWFLLFLIVNFGVDVSFECVDSDFFWKITVFSVLKLFIPLMSHGGRKFWYFWLEILMILQLNNWLKVNWKLVSDELILRIRSRHQSIQSLKDFLIFFLIFRELFVDLFWKISRQKWTTLLYDVKIRFWANFEWFLMNLNQIKFFFKRFQLIFPIRTKF